MSYRNNSAIIQDNSMFAHPYKKKRKKTNKLKVGKILPEEINLVVDKVTTKIPRVTKLDFSTEWRQIKGLFLVDDHHRLLICIKYNDDKVKDKLKIVCEEKKYKYIALNLSKSNYMDDLIISINIYLDSFQAFIELKAKKLNVDIPKSELWFQEKFKKERFYNLLEVEYNKPFKLFIYDVYCCKFGFVIEVDGSIHNKPEIKEADRSKDRVTGTYGLQVIRIKAYSDGAYLSAMTRIKRILKRDGEKKYPAPKIILRKSSDNLPK